MSDGAKGINSQKEGKKKVDTRLNIEKETGKAGRPLTQSTRREDCKRIDRRKKKPDMTKENRDGVEKTIRTGFEKLPSAICRGDACWKELGSKIRTYGHEGQNGKLKKGIKFWKGVQTQFKPDREGRECQSLMVREAKRGGIIFRKKEGFKIKESIEKGTNWEYVSLKKSMSPLIRQGKESGGGKRKKTSTIGMDSNVRRSEQDH